MTLVAADSPGRRRQSLYRNGEHEEENPSHHQHSKLSPSWRKGYGLQLGYTFSFPEKSQTTTSYSRIGERQVKPQAGWEGIIRTLVCLHTRVPTEKVFGLMFSLKAKLWHLKDKLTQLLEILLSPGALRERLACKRFGIFIGFGRKNYECIYRWGIVVAFISWHILSVTPRARNICVLMSSAVKNMLKTSSG